MYSFHVVLVVPPLVHAGVAFTSVAGPEHMGVAYLAAALRRAGFKVTILNFDLETYIRVMAREEFLREEPSHVEMAEQVLACEPDYVGVSVTGPALESALGIAAEVKKRAPGLHVSFGGHQATATAADLIAEETVIDSIGLGDCDYSIVEVVARLCRGESLEGSWGFLFRRKDGSIGGGWPPSVKPGQLVRIGEPALREEDDRYGLAGLPHPARDDLMLIQKRLPVREARLSTSRGCMDFCTFCATSSSAGFRSHSLRPPDDVVAEMETLHRDYGIEHFWFVDDNYVSRDPVSQERAEEIARLMIGRDLRFTMRAYFRADAFDGREELLPLLFECGVVMGLIGLESGSPQRLKYFGKRCSVNQARSAVAQVRATGMGLQIGFIFYDPLTSFEDMRIDANFLDEIGEGYVLFNWVQNLDAYPGTSYRRLLERKGVSTASHPYRGGFRQYVYLDPRVAPLAAFMDRLYEPELVAIDRSLMRLRCFKVPRLRWLELRGALPGSARARTRAIDEETEDLCRRIGEMHSRWVRGAIDDAETGLDEQQVADRLERLLAARQPHLDRLMELSGETDRLAETYHRPGVSRAPSAIGERRAQQWSTI